MGEVDVVDKLTPRQRAIMRLKGHGLTEREIGQRLGLKYNTIKTYRARAMRRTGKTSIELAVAVALVEAGMK